MCRVLTKVDEKACVAVDGHFRAAKSLCAALVASTSSSDISSTHAGNQQLRVARAAACLQLEAWRFASGARRGVFERLSWTSVALRPGTRCWPGVTPRVTGWFAPFARQRDGSIVDLSATELHRTVLHTKMRVCFECNGPALRIDR